MPTYQHPITLEDMEIFWHTLVSAIEAHPLISFAIAFVILAPIYLSLHRAEASTQRESSGNS